MINLVKLKRGPDMFLAEKTLALERQVWPWGLENDDIHVI
jgi:hypothetical protein